MKKKLALLLGSLMLAISLTACGTDPKDVDYNGKTYDALETEMTTYVNAVSTLYSGISSMIEEQGMTDFDYSQLTSDEIVESYSQYGITKEQLAAVETWAEVAEQYGDYEESLADSFTITKSGNTTTSDITLIFMNENEKEKKVTFEIVYESWNMEISGITIEPVKSLGEKMSNAGLNTLISIVIVFLVLILISLIIYAFNIFPYIEKRKKEKAQQKASVEDAGAVATSVDDSVVETDDYELVAVIAAAIAASEGCSTSDFVVRSINRR